MTTNPTDLISNRFLGAIREGRPAIGTWILAVRTPSIVRMAAKAGFDYVFIDMEHSSFDWETVADMCELARASGITPIVRPFDHASGVLNRVQDLGALGLMFYDVSRADQLLQLRERVMYPPIGERGHTSASPALDYSSANTDSSKAFVNENMAIVIQIESRAGVENIEDIVDAGGIDLVEIGTGDLSTSLGVPFQQRHPDVMAAADRVIEACRQKGIVVGMTCSSVSDAEDLLERGVRCLTYSSDRHILMATYREAVDQLQSLVMDLGK
ncbi:MAG: aldolase/citrate lyase family protein [Acidimicrobiia bacterium]